MKKTIENKVADAILQKAEQIQIGGRTFDVTPPTPATLIMVSEEIANLPSMETDEIASEVLVKAKDAKPLGRIAATLILGAKRVKENRKIRVKLWRRQSEIDWLTDYILDNVTTNELSVIVSQRLAQMQIGDFFGLTASLKGANLTKATKEAETAFGGL